MLTHTLALFVSLSQLAGGKVEVTRESGEAVSGTWSRASCAPVPAPCPMWIFTMATAAAADAALHLRVAADAALSAGGTPMIAPSSLTVTPTVCFVLWGGEGVQIHRGAS